MSQSSAPDNNNKNTKLSNAFGSQLIKTETTDEEHEIDKEYLEPIMRKIGPSLIFSSGSNSSNVPSVNNSPSLPSGSSSRAVLSGSNLSVLSFGNATSSSLPSSGSIDEYKMAKQNENKLKNCTVNHLKMINTLRSFLENDLDTEIAGMNDLYRKFFKCSHLNYYPRKVKNVKSCLGFIKKAITSFITAKLTDIDSGVAHLCQVYLDFSIFTSEISQKFHEANETPRKVLEYKNRVDKYKELKLQLISLISGQASSNDRVVLEDQVNSNIPSGSKRPLSSQMKQDPENVELESIDDVSLQNDSQFIKVNKKLKKANGYKSLKHQLVSEASGQESSNGRVHEGRNVSKAGDDSNISSGSKRPLSSQMKKQDPENVEVESIDDASLQYISQLKKKIKELKEQDSLKSEELERKEKKIKLLLEVLQT